MNGHSGLARSNIRAGLESSLGELTNLAERSSAEHKVVSEVMKDLEACRSGILQKSEFQNAIVNNPTLQSVPREQLKSFIDSAFAIADKDSRGHVERNALR